MRLFVVCKSLLDKFLETPLLNTEFTGVEVVRCHVQRADVTVIHFFSVKR